MKLNEYLRSIINNKIRPLFIKEKCEVCNSTEELNLHHTILFSDILSQALKDLNLFEKDTKDYTIKELRLIINIILGYHLQIEYITLCSSCHKLTHNKNKESMCINDKHKEHYQALNIKKELKRNIYINKTLIPYLDNIVNKKLYKDDKEKLINKIDARNRGRLLKSYAKLNEEFKKYNIPYKIINKRNNNKRYWIIEKEETNG